MSRKRKRGSSKNLSRVASKQAVAATAGGGAVIAPDPPTQVRPGWRQSLQALLPAGLICVLVLVVYANAWPDALVHDDKFYAGSERFADLANIPRYFAENAWAASGVTEPQYRPLLLATITLDARVHGDWAAGYHLTNIVLHLAVSVLVFVFLLQLLQMIRGASPANRHMALLAAAVFAVHPVHTEVVNSIFNRSDMLVALSGLAGLCWLLHHMHARPARAWTGLCIAYSVALFSKEGGLVLPGLAVAVVLAVTPGSWMSRARKCLPVLWSLIPLALYFALRAQALAPVEAGDVASAAAADLAPAVGSMLDRFSPPGSHRLMRLAGLWYESFRIMVWPVPLSVKHAAPGPWEGGAGLALHLALVPLVIYQLRHRRYGLILGLVFFHIALLPASRIIGDPDTFPHLAERYLYFPSVGAAIALAFGLAAAARRVDSRWLTAIAGGVVLALAPITFARNAVWSSDVKLFESEYRNGNASYQVLVWLTAAHLQQRGYERTAELCDRHLGHQERRKDRNQESAGKLSTHCAIAYSQLGRHEEAERAYLLGTRDREVKAMAHANLARYYLDRGRRQDARTHFEAAIAAETLPANKAYRRGHMLVRLYPRDRQKLLEAKAQFELALELQPAFGPARQWLSQVNRILGVR